MNAFIVAASCLAIAVTGPRWLRIAQREHYLAGAATRFATRWWLRTGAVNLALLLLASVGFIAVWVTPPAGLLCIAVEIVGPIGLSPRGSTSPLIWTRRMRTTAAVVVIIDTGSVVLGVLAGVGAALAACLCTVQPFVVDVALAICAPFERAAMNRFVGKATRRLQSVAPLTIALTGSYGKTSTKMYARHLIGGSRTTLASPASFNNMGGLARTINEHLADGTEVFIAEMGTYGPGEIAAMCDWIKPKIGAIVNIGPVHLERMRSLDVIVKAKSEIVANVEAAVINIDAYGLAPIADEAESRGISVVRFSAVDASADAAVLDGTVYVAGEPVSAAPRDAVPINVAAAVAIALVAGVPVPQIAARLASLPVPEHRREIATAPSGAVVIDNTFSSNPASAALSLAALDAHHRPGGRAVVVTPGLVELGPRQASENEAFAAAAARVATDVVVVRRSNRRALVRGARGGPATLRLATTRDKAVAWVRDHVGAGDVVLYENDLPDHYP